MTQRAEELVRRGVLDDRRHRAEATGVGVEPKLAAVRQWLVDAEIRVSGRVVYRTPET